MKAIKEINTPFIKGRSCLFSALRVIALLFHRNYPEGYIHSFSGGWEVFYGGDKKSGIPLVFPQIEYCVSEFSKNCGLSYHVYQGEFVRECTRELLLGESKVFLAIINLSILPSRDRALDTIIKDEIHFIIIFGLDNDRRVKIYDPYLVNRKGEIETMFCRIPLDKLCNGIIECYCIEEAQDILKKDAIENVHDKISRFFHKQKVNNMYFGYAACLALSEDLRDGCFNGKQLVQMAFMIKTSLFYTLDYLPDILANGETDTYNMVDEKIRNQKKDWNSMYFRLLRRGYADKVLLNDEKKELADQLYETLLHYKDLFSFLVQS